MRINTEVYCGVSDQFSSSRLTSSYQHITWVIIHRDMGLERNKKQSKHRERDHLSCNPIKSPSGVGRGGMGELQYVPGYSQGGAGV